MIFLTLRRSWKQAKTWAGSEELLENYLKNVSAGQQYANYSFDP